MATDCSSGRPQHEAWYEMYPAAPVYLNTSHVPGVRRQQHHRVGDLHERQLVHADAVGHQQGWTFTTTKSLSAPRSSAEVIIESPTGAYPNFGSIQFTNCTVNGSPLGSFSPTALDPSANGITEAHTNPLSGGTNFSMDYQHE